MHSTNSFFIFLGIGMHVEVKDPDDKEMLSRVYSAEGMSNVKHLCVVRGIYMMNNYMCRFFFIPGKFSFTSHSPGEHTICLYSNTSQWFSGSQLRVHFDIQVGEHAVDYAQVAQKEKLTELQLRIRQLLNQVDQITKEQNYQRVSFTLSFLTRFSLKYCQFQRKNDHFRIFSSNF